jgi:hypothetical protein
MLTSFQERRSYAELVCSARVCALAIAIAGCEPMFEPEAPEPRFFASLSGSVAAEYTGSGTFYLGSLPRRPAGVGPQMFYLRSDGIGASRGMQIAFSSLDPVLPEPGAYPLGVGSPMHAQLSELDPGGATRQMYTVTGGELVLTKVSADRIEGTFRFEGVGLCMPTGSGGIACTSVAGAPQDAPRIDVNGHFSAVPDR